MPAIDDLGLRHLSLKVFRYHVWYRVLDGSTIIQVIAVLHHKSTTSGYHVGGSVPLPRWGALRDTWRKPHPGLAPPSAADSTPNLAPDQGFSSGDEEI